MKTRPRRLRGLAVCTAAVTALVLTACSPAGSAADSSSSPSSGANQPATSDAGSANPDDEDTGTVETSDSTSDSEPGGETASGGTLVVARTGDIDKVDPHLATAFQTIETLGLVYQTLVTTSDDGKLVPSLATKWESSDDGTTFTFQLRDNVTWHNGDPFTSADVKASLQRILDEDTGAVGRSNLTSITSVVTPDDHTAVLHLSGANASILYALVSVNAAIVHDEDIKDGSVSTDPNGTGPFSWGSWEQDQKVTMKASKDYWGDAPGYDTLEFRVIPSESSILSGMKAGAFQIGVLSDPSVAAQGDGASNFNLVKQPSLSYHTLMLNGRHKPLDNIQVRQAIACAIDRQQVIDTAAFGDGEVTGPITSPAYQYSPTDGLPCKPGDTDAAKKLLADAGYSDGIKLKTIVETGEYATSVAEGQNLQSQLKKIGVDLELKQLPTSPYVKAWLDADFDAAVALNGGRSDPYLMYSRYYTTDGSLKGPAGLTSQKLNELLMKGNSTDDESARQATYQQLQEEMLKESPWVWVFRGDGYYLVSSDVSDFTARADQSLINLATAGLSS